MFDKSEVLIPAKKLSGLIGISIDHSRHRQGYAHLLFDRHEVIFAEGAPAESLLPGPQALKMMGEAARSEISSVFPELEEADARNSASRLIPPGNQQKQLVSRHHKNAKPLLSPAL